VDVVVGRGTLLAGRYRLDEPTTTDLPGVASWDARDQILDRPVRALVLRDGRIRQAQDAARRAALVSDPRLLRVLDVGDHDGVPYVVTERVVGRDLASLTAGGPMPADQARAIIGEAAVALEVARRRGVHHLALRPCAVHVTAEGAVLVSGLALDGELAGHGLGDARSTTRADTVGLVALLYLLLTGRWPAPAGVTTTGTTVPLVTGDLLAPAEVAPRVPNDLDTLCAVTLGPHDDGPHSPAELVRELEPWGALAAAEVFAGADARSEAASAAAMVAAAAAKAVVAAPAPVAAVPASVVEPVVEPVVDDGVDLVEDPASPDVPADGTTDADAQTTAVDLPVEAVLDDATDDAATPPDEAPALPIAPEDDAPSVQRTSVRSSMAQTPGPAARPGTPPPAIPPANRRPDPRDAAVGTAAVGAAAVVPTAQASAGPPHAGLTPARHPHGGHPEADHRDFDTLIGRSTDALTRRRFDPTPVVLGLVVIAVVVGLVLAWQALTAPAPPIGGNDGFGDVSDAASASAEPGVPAAPADGAAAVAPVIAGALMIDPPPGGDNNEHPEAVPAGVDGDPATFWFSRTYASPTYGMKPGIGYAVTLAAPATVTTVTLLVNGTGGMVEVRATDPATPTEGEVLASGPLTAETVLTLSAPTTATSIVLWFTALPQTADGANRVELAEVRLS